MHDSSFNLHHIFLLILHHHHILNSLTVQLLQLSTSLQKRCKGEIYQVREKIHFRICNIYVHTYVFICVLCMQQAQIKKCFYSCVPYSNNNPSVLLSSLESQTEKKEKLVSQHLLNSKPTLKAFQEHTYA